MAIENVEAGLPTDVTLEQALAHLRDLWRERALAVPARGFLNQVEGVFMRYRDAHQRHARCAFARELGMEVVVPDTEALALALLEAVEALPELAAGRPTAPALRVVAQALPPWPEGGDGAVVKPTWPKLWAATQDRPLLLVGGTPVRAAERWVRDAIMGDAEWIGTEDASAGRIIDRVVNQMKAGTCAAVIYFVGFMSHQQTKPVLDATRATGVPSTDGNTGGRAGLLAAFEALERALPEAPK